jgi:VanZ family protein
MSRVNSPPRRRRDGLAVWLWPVAAAIWSVAVIMLAVRPDTKSLWLAKTLGDKVIHAGAFAVGAIVWTKSVQSLPRLRMVWSFTAGALATLAVGAAIELLQRHVPGRKSDIHDFFADVVGVVAALIILALVSSRRPAPDRTA